jgi:hypothetical protein
MVALSSSQRALFVFDAFLTYARECSPAAEPRSQMAEQSEGEVTRVAGVPTQPPLPQISSDWEEPTEKGQRIESYDESHRQDEVVTAVAQQAMVFEQSIIIDDDSLTSPEITRDAELARGSIATSLPNPLTVLLQELAVLVKYGHAVQATQELDLWSTSHPEDLHGHLRVAEFEMARIDRERALQRYSSLIALFSGRGEVRVALDILRRLRRDLPGDPRVIAIAQWNNLIP